MYIAYLNLTCLRRRIILLKNSPYNMVCSVWRVMLMMPSQSEAIRNFVLQLDLKICVCVLTTAVFVHATTWFHIICSQLYVFDKKLRFNFPHSYGRIKIVRQPDIMMLWIIIPYYTMLLSVDWRSNISKVNRVVLM